MTVVIDATDGGASANSYCTLAYADDYHDSRLHNSVWTAATDATKNTALVWATRVFESKMSWYGAKLHITQKLGYPRYGVYNENGYLMGYDYSTLQYSVPDELKNATAELAFWLITADRMADPGSKGIKTLSVDVIKLEFDKGDYPTELPNSVVGMLSRLGRYVSGSSGQIRVRRC